MKIEHIAMYVADLEREKAFFEKYFNAISSELYYNRKTGFRSYFMTFSDGARLEIMNKPYVTEKADTSPVMGFAHIAISLGNREAVDSLTETLGLDGFEVISKPRVTGDGYYESCVLDFEGNCIELTE